MSWRVWAGVGGLAMSGVVLAVGVWIGREQLARERALQASMGRATAVRPWFELPAVAPQARPEAGGRNGPGSDLQGTRRHHFPPAESAQATAPQLNAARDAGPDRNMRVREAMKSVSVKLYMADFCPACQQAKRWLHESGVRYDELDIESSDSARAHLRSINPRRTIPTFEIDGAVLVGFSAGSVQSALRRAAEARVRREEGAI